MRAAVVYWAGWLALLAMGVTTVQGSDSCRVSSYVFSCVLDILEEHIVATARVNYCHLPIDVTFLVNYQYGNYTSHHWKYTFVTSNQNERVLIPGLQLPTAPHAPVFLYVRVPHQRLDLHNASYMAIEASFVAELKKDEWEEAEFINHTVALRPTEECRFTPQGRDPIPWIVGGLFLVVVVCGLGGAGYYVYRRRKQAQDQLALVTAMEVGLPGAQPYQMGGENKSGEADQVPKKDTGQDAGVAHQNNEHSDDTSLKGKKGFKFSRLREENGEIPKEFQQSVDSSVVIGNPVFLEDAGTFGQSLEDDHRHSDLEALERARVVLRDERDGRERRKERGMKDDRGKQRGNNKEMEKNKEMRNGIDEGDAPIKEHKVVNGGYSVEQPEQSPEDSRTPDVDQADTPSPPESLDDVRTQHSDDSVDGGQQVGRGARAKVRGAASLPPPAAVPPTLTNGDSLKSL